MSYKASRKTEKFLSFFLQPQSKRKTLTLIRSSRCILLAAERTSVKAPPAFNWKLKRGEQTTLCLRKTNAFIYICGGKGTICFGSYSPPGLPERLKNEMVIMSPPKICGIMEWKNSFSMNWLNKANLFDRIAAIPTLLDTDIEQRRHDRSPIHGLLLTNASNLASW